jgi:hypothetical protein
MMKDATKFVKFCFAQIVGHDRPLHLRYVGEARKRSRTPFVRHHAHVEREERAAIIEESAA